ncbi:MAG: ribonucleoside-diphosphate reductase [Halobacteriales archaeon]|nr:ribonucleoside-diphosphate reductase [Halobacteriales archaeon]
MYMDVEPQLDLDERSYRYYRNAVERHWDPYGIGIEKDRANLLDADLDDEVFEGMRVGIARFGAGEEAVTEDLAPFTVVLEDIEDQMYVTTQIYEEAKHTDFFDRYWRNVINPVEEARGLGRSSPLEDRWFNDDYDELFERNERATYRLLEDDTPENRARAFSHYHLTIEGIAAQTGYYGMGRAYSEDEFPELPHLPGLVEGLNHTRADEGRHVGFGMSKLKELIQDENVDPTVIDETVAELVPLVQGIVNDEEYQEDRGVPSEELEMYAAEKHIERMEQVKDAAKEMPGVEELVALDD